MIVWIQVPVFRLGKSIGDNLASLRNGIVQTGLTNAFIVFSNNAAPAYRKRYLGEGAQRFLDKTTEFDQLAAAVARASQTH